MRNCSICQHLCIEPRPAAGVIGLETSNAWLIDEALDRLDKGDSDHAHVLVPVCSDHVVDIYRGKVDGVRMAWRLVVSAS